MLVNEKLVVLQMHCEDSRDAIRILGKKLFENGKVKPTYVDAVLKREKIYPTGLPVPEICIAIPHTDSSYVLESAIAVGTLQNPVSFRMMGSPERNLPVELVIMIAVDNPERQLGVLQTLMKIFQDGGLLKRLKNAKNPFEVCENLKVLNMEEEFQ